MSGQPSWLWQHLDPFTPGTLIRADSINVKFDGIATSLAEFNNTLDTRMIKLPAGFQGTSSIPEKTLLDGYFTVTVSGNVDFEPYVQTERRLKTRPRIVMDTITGDFDISGTFEDQRYYTVDSENDVDIRVTEAAGDNLKGTVVYINRYGLGDVRIIGDAGVTINAPSTTLIRSRYSTAMLVYRGSNEWDLCGDLVAFD